MSEEDDEVLDGAEDLGPEEDIEEPIGEREIIDASVTAKEAERERIRLEIEAFLSQGGKIVEVSSNVMNDPPRRPQANYGGQPI